MNIESIKLNEAYSCDFILEDMPLDEWNRPGGMFSLADQPIARIGTYMGSGQVTTRDLNQKLVEVIDEKLNKKFVVEFKNISNLRVFEEEEIADV